jgi:hypothetical protein
VTSGEDELEVRQAASDREAVKRELEQDGEIWRDGDQQAGKHEIAANADHVVGIDGREGE